MIGSLIAAAIGNYMTTCFVIGLVVAAIVIARHHGHRSAALVSGVLLNTYVFWAIGISQVLNFVMHSVFGDFAAKTIGWAQSPFQLELAFSSLGVGVMAFILYGRSSQLRGKAAVVIATAIFGYGAAAGHIYQLIVNNDHATNNSGLLLFMDVIIPTVGIAFVIWRAVCERHDAAARSGATIDTNATSGAAAAVESATSAQR